ncbi:hypothetical protein GNP84_06810 [Aliivibrio fischeri]|uniref:hypothetical protein n=1 Tax=Aliivibrio fischeri TaxID=668 RepID=UPI0012D929AC|nr:hypothetical protein [Aliivibrio fischeri]MUK76616.1 hypothetical protein [Aliivibrio fischeri]
MKNITIKSSVYILVGVSAVVWVLFAYLGGLDLSKIKDFLSLIPKVVTIDLLLIAFFVKWGWKLRWFRGWLVPFPNLNGTWTGVIYSHWKNNDSIVGFIYQLRLVATAPLKLQFKVKYLL